MSIRYVAFTIVLCVSSSDSRAQLPGGAASQPTPRQWTVPATVRFDVYDSKHVSLGAFTLRLTNQPATACIVCNWFKAEPVSSNLKVLDLTRWWADKALVPSYEIRGRIFNVILDGGNICDDYPAVQAELSDSDARGTLGYSGIFKQPPLGNVTITIVR